MKVARSELLPANPDIVEGVDDLIQLSYLNEPSVLHNLRFRYAQDMIYVCVSIQAPPPCFITHFLSYATFALCM